LILKFPLNITFKQIVFLLFFHLIGCATFAQKDALSPSSADAKTYQLFQEKNWPELIKVGNQALEKGYDFYYMRVRVGIAYFEKGNYGLAGVHFKEALDFNANDPLAQAYLYFCYLYNGKDEEARNLSTTFSLKLKTKMGLDDLSVINFINVEGGPKISSPLSFNAEPSSEDDYFFNPATYFQVGIKHHPKNKFSLFHAATFFNQESYPGKVQQLQYYLHSAIPLKNNWLISPAIHLVRLKFSTEYETLSTVDLTNTQTETFSSTSNYFIASFSIKKSIRKFDFSGGSTYANISEAHQYNHFGDMSFHVFGNSKLVLGLTAYLHTKDDYTSTYNSYAPFIYFQATKFAAVKFTALFNQGNNIIEGNGYLVNNSSDLTKERYNVLVNLRMSKTISLYGMYQLEFKEDADQLFDYHYNMFLAGIKISPHLK
jgi:tetratricopeptide (TPR) repeat protein